jgi:uncharacterized membrane protein YwzB
MWRYTEKNVTHWRYQSFYFLKEAFCGEKELCMFTVTTSLGKKKSIFHFNLLSIVVAMTEKTVAMEGRNMVADDESRCVLFCDNCSWSDSDFGTSTKTRSLPRISKITSRSLVTFTVSWSALQTVNVLLGMFIRLAKVVPEFATIPARTGNVTGCVTWCRWSASLIAST